jgi:N-acetylglucosaminyl-diphospho-decaprenol L-rhamnosyltransferase
MKLSIVIVNWNSFDYLQKCVASLARHTKCAYEVIVVDNASPAGDADRIKKEMPDVQLVCCSVNAGFGSANNRGFRQSKGEFVLFLNPDTELLNSAADMMIEAMSAGSNSGIMGCNLLNEDMSVQTSCVQTFPTILNQLLDSDWLRKRLPNSPLWGTQALWLKSKLPQQVEVISGACMLMRRQIFEQVGGFTDAYFMYAEDLDLCYKVRKAGYGNYYYGPASVIHYGGKSSNPERATPMKWKSITMFCEMHRGRFYTLIFRCAMSASAIVRLGMIAGARAYGSILGTRKPKSASSIKWMLILRTMLTP